MALIQNQKYQSQLFVPFSTILRYFGAHKIQHLESTHLVDNCQNQVLQLHLAVIGDTSVGDIFKKILLYNENPQNHT